MNSTPIEELTDKQLVEMALSNNQLAYTTLVQRYQNSLYLYVKDFIGSLKIKELNTELAEQPQDIVQEAFHKAFQALDTYNNKYEFSTWLFNIAKNTFIDYTRKRKISIGANLSPDNFYGITNIGDGIKNSPEDKLISTQEYGSLIAIINSLDEKYRKPAQLRFIDEYAYDEISNELGLELNTVKTRLKRAKELIKKIRGLK